MSDQKLCTAKLNFALFLIAHFLSFVINALRVGKSSLIDPTKHHKNWNNGDPYKSHWTGVFDTVGANATFAKENCVRENIELYPADAATVQVTLTVYFSWEIPMRLKEMVKSNKESIQGVNFCELRHTEKKALKAPHWDAQTSEKVENGRHKRPIEYNKLSAASGKELKDWEPYELH
ncbi:hypothetical protein ACE6H2_020530 [Prunus campanulata]